MADLLPPKYWIGKLAEYGWLAPGTVLLSGTLPMRQGPNQFGSRWEVELFDSLTGDALSCGYDVVQLPKGDG